MIYIKFNLFESNYSKKLSTAKKYRTIWVINEWMNEECIFVIGDCCCSRFHLFRGDFFFTIFVFLVTFDIWCVDFVNITDKYPLQYIDVSLLLIQTKWFTHTHTVYLTWWRQQQYDPLKYIVQLAHYFYGWILLNGVFVEANVLKVSLTWVSEWEIYAMHGYLWLQYCT